MKKINSINYGGKVIGVAIGIGLVIPICFRLVNLFINSSVLDFLMWCFVAVGSFLLLGFFLYLGVELHQDKKIGEYYDAHRNIKLTGNGQYCECYNCGNQKVNPKDTVCMVCGVRFSKEPDRSVQEILKRH